MIEASRQLITDLPITAKMISSLRESAKIASTHHSTYIEGNGLSLAEVRTIIQDNSHFPNREKDEKEIRNYYQALDAIDKMALDTIPIQELDIQYLHGISFLGKTKPTPYRDGQNVIRAGKLVVYIPPKATDVPSLMQDLIDWINQSIKDDLPLPIITGLAHYQFATIHPYYDGNGRTARLLVTLILHKYHYGLKGIYSLEEYYAKDLHAYYQALTVGSDEDYYQGHREEADLTNFLEYFIEGMAHAFETIKTQAKTAQTQGSIDQSPLLRNLTRQQKLTLKLFITSKEITTKDIADLFQFSDRQARYLCQEWISNNFIKIANPASKNRSYQLTEKYESLILNSIEIHG
ncbi:MAG: Fic family protein [Alphaproteobacteria bacterium]|nr:Fic family protein [Alphaproteobacteria bacterium]